MAETTGAPRRHRRHLRNYLLDRSYQLKYAGYLAAVAAVLSLSLGYLLWRTSQTLVQESQEAVKQGQQVVGLGHEVVEQSRKVSEVVQMTIEKDPMYADNPELLEEYKKESAKKEQPLKARQEALEAQTAALQQRSAQLAERQQMLFTTLVVVLLALVIGVGLAGIVVTHKVAGPIFKMKRQIQDVEQGSWKRPAKLRKGDELEDFFSTFDRMVQSLRKRRNRELELLDEAMTELEPTTAPRELEKLKALRVEMHEVLDG